VNRIVVIRAMVNAAFRSSMEVPRPQLFNTLVKADAVRANAAERRAFFVDVVVLFSHFLAIFNAI